MCGASPFEFVLGCCVFVTKRCMHSSLDPPHSCHKPSLQSPFREGLHLRNSPLTPNRPNPSKHLKKYRSAH